MKIWDVEKEGINMGGNYFLITFVRGKRKKGVD